jgi:hypothetical protein
MGYYWETESGSASAAARLGSEVRRQLGRAQRKLAADLGVRFDLVATESSDLNSALLQQFIELESSGWKGEQGTSIKHRPGNAVYFQAIVERCSKAGFMRWYRLSAEGRIVAMCLGFQTHDTVRLVKSAYDEACSEYRPGHVLLREILDHCISDPSVNRCDNISSPEWLDRWRPSREFFYEVRVFCPTVMGVVAHFGNAGRDFMRGASRRSELDAADRERRFV